MASSAKAETKTTPSTTPVRGLREEVSQRYTPAQAKRSRLLGWMDALWSLWAPLCIFGLVFLPYILLIELVPGSYLWAQPILKGFGLLMVVYFVALLIARAVPWPGSVLFAHQRDARELTLELDRIMARAGDRLPRDSREKLVAQAIETDEARLGGDADTLGRSVEKLNALADQLLSPWKKQGAMDFTGGLVKALAIALLIRTVLIEPFKIPSGSMIPTLEIGDQVFVNKFLYGVRIPFTNYVPFQLIRAPDRGDVIVFNNPVRPADDYIKRVVAIAGDRVEMVDQVLVINGQPQERQLLDPNHIAQQKAGDEWVAQRRVLYEENLFGHTHRILQEAGAIDSEQRYGPYVVPEGHVFVLGDNRNDSSDSRYGLGEGGGLGWSVEYVPVGNIKGKAMVIWLALGHEGFLSGLFGGTGLRTDRLFLPVR